MRKSLNFSIVILICLFPIVSGVTLEGANSTEVWDPEHKTDDADGANQQYGADQKLIIKMVSYCMFNCVFIYYFKFISSLTNVKVS